MGILLDNRNVTVTLWRFLGQDAFNNPTYQPPVQIQCRYLDTESVFVDNNGREVTSRTAIVTEDLALQIGDWIVLGTSAEASPTEDARQLVMVSHRRFVSNNADVYKGML